jgi:hypothetical protein
VGRLKRAFHMVSTDQDAIGLAMRNGLDVQGCDYAPEFWKENVIELVNKGKLSMERLDEIVSRVLRVKFEMGLFEHPYTDEHKWEEVIRCEELEPLGAVCEDSCLEFFIRPTEAMNYFNFEYNYACNVYLGYGTGNNDLIRLIPENQKEIFHPKSYKTADGWGVTYHIPVTFIRQFFPAFEAYEGLQFYGNFYRSGEKAVAPYGMSWHPIEPTGITIHCPAYFGRLILGGEEI